MENNHHNQTAEKLSDLLNNICSNSQNASGCLEFLKPPYREGDTLQNLPKMLSSRAQNFYF